LRFLNLNLTSPETGELKIEFTRGLNIISIPDKETFSLFSRITSAGIYGAVGNDAAHLPEQISCTINAVSAISDVNVIFRLKSGCFTISESDSSGEGITGDAKPENERYINTYTPDDFFTSSFFSSEKIQKSGEPVFDKEKVQSLLVNSEINRPDFPFFHQRKNIMQQLEKELTSLDREKQLLELKKMKKEKLLKEIQISERSLHKLEKRKESIIKYKFSLNDILSKIEARNRISSKINNLKKDLIELHEIKEKITSVEKNLKEKFSHFADKGDEQIPDLEQIQESFNSFRDTNEQLDKFSLNKKFYSEWALRLIASMIIFSVIAFLFMIFTSSASFILGITSASSAGTAGITGLIYYYKIRRLYPGELLEKKREMETSLIDLLKKNNFSFDNCKTGELYEILFQYFEDFINYRDISYELTDLKKKISNSSTLTEKEKKLEQLDNEVEDINSSINEIIDNLELSIHPRPDFESIGKTIHEIDDLFEENETEINDKKSLIIKFNEEIEQYDKTENSTLSLDVKMDDLLNRINGCRENLEHAKFLNTVFNEAAEAWSTDRLQELSAKTLEKFLKLTDSSFIKEDIADTINNIIITSENIKSEHKGLKKYLAFSIKAALSEMLLNRDLPPLFIIDPFTIDNEFADNMKKLLPELFPERQVVIIIPGTEPDLKGNLITL